MDAKVSNGQAAPWNWFKILGIPGDRYAVLETDDGVVLLDPRAAHERVLYEQLAQQWQQRGVDAQGLLAPESVALPPRDARVIADSLELMAQMGFEVAPFGGDTFLVEAVPAMLSEMAPKRILETWVSVLHEQGTAQSESVRGEALLKAACREAVGLRQRFAESELEALVNQLGETDMPYTSPSGRPTMMLLGYRELDRRFGRS